MARFSFGIFGLKTNELQAGLKVYIKNSNGEIVASTESGVYEYDIIDNNDGTYYVDGLPTGVYSVYVNNPNTPQPEMQNIPFVNDEDLQHFSSPAPHSGHASVEDLEAHVNAPAPHSGHAPLSHAHTEQDIVDLDKYTKSEIDSLLEEKADTDHVHEAKQITIEDAGNYFYGNNVEAALQELAKINIQGSAPGRLLYQDVARGNAGDTIDFPVYTSTAPNWQDIIVLPFAKNPGESFIDLVFEACFTTEPDADIGIRLVVHTNIEEFLFPLDIISPEWLYWKISAAIQNLSLDEIYYCKVQLKNEAYAAGTLKVRKIILSTR